MSIGSLQLVGTWGVSLSPDGGQSTAKNVRLRQQNRPKCLLGRGILGCSPSNLSSRCLIQDEWCAKLWHHVYAVPLSTTASSRGAVLRTKASATAVAEQSKNIAVSSAKIAGFALIKVFNVLRGEPLVAQCCPAMALMAFSAWGLLPTMRLLRKMVKKKEDAKWPTCQTRFVSTAYVRPLLLWIGVIVICRAFDPVILSTSSSQAIKARFINFVQSLSTVLTFAYCASNVTRQIQYSMMEGPDKKNSRNLGVQFVGNTVYTSVWVASVCLFMELLGFSTQRWITAGGFGTVLLTLAGREIFTNFLSSIMIHATRPFVENEWIQTKIEGQEVSGTVEHVGWWSPTVIRGDDREAVHIPNHKFSVSVVRNLTQKTHWRIKTHFGVSHLDVSKVPDIVSDMRKVISKHPQVEQQRLHRRAFFDNVDRENQAILILVSCFVKTSHFEEYLRVKVGSPGGGDLRVKAVNPKFQVLCNQEEIILLDLLRVISHHNARLATPIRSVQRILDEQEARSVPFRDVGSASERKKPLYMIEASTVPVSDSEEPDNVKVDAAPVRYPETAREKTAKEARKEDLVKETGKENKGKAVATKGPQSSDGASDAKTKPKSKDTAQVVGKADSKSGAPSPGNTALASGSSKPHLGSQSSDLALDAKTKPKSKENAQVVGKADLKSGSPSPGDTSLASGSSKPQLEGLDSMGLNSKDITLLKAAFEKPPADIPQGPVDSGPRVDINQGEKAGSKPAAEQQKALKTENSGAGNEQNEQLKVFRGTEKPSKQQTDDDPWREQSAGSPQPALGSQQQKSENGQLGGAGRGPEDKGPSGQGGQAQSPAQAPVPRLQSVEENLVLGVALDGPNRTLPLDDEMPPPAKSRELVTSRNNNSSTPPKDQRDPAHNPQSNTFDGRDRES